MLHNNFKKKKTIRILFRENLKRKKKQTIKLI